MLNTPKNPKRVAPPQLLSIHGENCTVKKVHIQLIPVEKERAYPRTRFGNISEVTTHITGAKLAAKKEIYTNRAIRTPIPPHEKANEAVR